MKRAEYRSALKAAREELELSRAERHALDSRIARLQHTVASLEALCDETPSFGEGLTEACRTVLKAAGQPMTALDVKAQLGALGLAIGKYSNPLASVHTVLKRLAHSGEVTVVYGKGKPDAYQWTHWSTLVGGGASAAYATWIAARLPTARRSAKEHDDEK
jgi:hypothetical protein